MKAALTLFALVNILMPTRVSPFAGLPDTQSARVVNSFRFHVPAPIDRVAPLFGPEAERRWAGQHWNPEFQYPQPAKDVQGAVFTVVHGQSKSTWVNTLFDVAGGRMQYVSFVPDALVTVVDVRVTAQQARLSEVNVMYTRTALNPALNSHVRELGERDRQSGPEWQTAIQTCLGGRRP